METDMNTQKTQENLYNRILINFGIGILAYAALYFLYQKLYMNNTITFITAGIFAAAAAACYALSKKKPLKNYGHMFAAFTIALLFTRLSVIIVSIFGMEKFFDLQNIYIVKKLMQTRTEVIIISWLGAVYLIGMLIYNSILMVKAGRKKKNKK